MNRTGISSRGAPLCVLAVVAVLSVGFEGCSGGSSGGSGAAPTAATFRVIDGRGVPVVGAVVYLVPAGDVDDSPFDAGDVLSGASEDFDEPVEDQVRLNGAGYPQAVTDANGNAFIPVIPSGDYFWHVIPAAGDLEHLPGGAGSRHVRNTASFLAATTTIELSSSPSSAATYEGSSTCLVCHGGLDTIAKHAHRLGFARPGQFGSLQDPVQYPQYQDGWNLFLLAAAFGGGTMITCTDYDPTRDFDKFKTFLVNPTGTVFLRAWLWRDTGDFNKFKITLQNVINPGDPASPKTLEVGLSYGGAVFRQRYLVKIPGRKGLYPLLTFQTQGDEAKFDRTRQVIRDFRLDSFWNAGAQTLVNPPLDVNFDSNCTACHATGFTRFRDPMTNEWLTDAVDDISGEWDLDGDGTPDELNIGCESCHGPGSEHVAWASNPANGGQQKRFIVNPRQLSATREVMLCGRCHDRPLGNWSVRVNEEPLDAAGNMARPGISRHDWLASYVSTKGPTAADVWADGMHSKNNHQQYSDLIKSTMHRNDRRLTVCSDCHGSHGEAPFDHQLLYDPADPDTFLCQQCHAVDILPHMTAKTGTTHAGPSTTCVRCHQNRTGQTGAGQYGLLDGTPTGGPGDDAFTYFENDLGSHLFGMPRKSNPSVAGITPALAMPIPYTNSCGGPCHSPGSIPFTK